MAELVFSAANARAGTDILLAWVEFTHVDAAGVAKTYYWSGIAMRDPVTYYGGFKTAKVLSYGSFLRPLADSTGQLQGMQFAFTLSDADGSLRAWMSNTYQKYLPNRDVVIRVATDTARRAGSEPRVIARGLVTDYEFLDMARVSFTCQDPVAADFETIVPRRRIMAEYFDAVADDVIGTTEPVPYGVLTGAAVPGIPVGAMIVSADPTWQGFVIAGCAVKSIDEVYLDGVAVDHARFGVDIMAPGFTGWPGGATHYVDVVGAGSETGTTRRYTLIFVHGDDAAALAAKTKTLSVDLHGVETVGDGSGTALTAVADQYRHFLVNFGIPQSSGATYTTGAWLSSATYGDGTAKILVTSFDTAASLATSVDSGYTGAFVIRTPVSLRDICQQFNDCANVTGGFNRLGQYIVIFRESGASSSLTLTETLDIIAGTYGTKDRVDQLVNALSYAYEQSYWGDSQDAYGAVAALSDATSITNYKQTIFGQDVPLPMIRDAATAEKVITRRLARQSQPPRMVRCTTGLYALNIELGDIISVTHRDSPIGSTALLVQVLSLDANLDDMTVAITGQAAWPSIAVTPIATPLGGASFYGGSSVPGRVPFAFITPASDVLQVPFPMGGIDQGSLPMPGTPAYAYLLNWTQFLCLADGSVRVRVWVWARTGGVGGYAQLWNVTDSTQTAVSGLITATTRASGATTFTATLTAGKVYVLRAKSDTNDADIYCIGQLEKL